MNKKKKRKKNKETWVRFRVGAEFLMAPADPIGVFPLSTKTANEKKWRRPASTFCSSSSTMISLIGPISGRARPPSAHHARLAIDTNPSKLTAAARRFPSLWLDVAFVSINVRLAFRWPGEPLAPEWKLQPWAGSDSRPKTSEASRLSLISFLEKKSEIEAPQRIIAGAKRFVLRQRTARVRFGSSAWPVILNKTDKAKIWLLVKRRWKQQVGSFYFFLQWSKWVKPIESENETQ